MQTTAVSITQNTNGSKLEQTESAIVWDIYQNTKNVSKVKETKSFADPWSPAATISANHEKYILQRDKTTA